MANEADDLGIPKKLVRPASAASEPLQPAHPARPVAELPPAAPPSPLPNLSRPFGTSSAIAPVAARSGMERPVGAGEHAIEARSLIVGQGIALSGEINACDRLVIEGSVRANLQDCQHMTITETGLFDGNAAIEEADVRGRFAGDLTVRKRLLIRAGGQVSGTITYGEIEIEAGGKISGTISAP